MANRSPSPSGHAEEKITLGTGNVFADLGYADAEERQTKLRLAYAINEIIASKRTPARGSASDSPRSRRSLTTNWKGFQSNA
jgi:hypothetical protein